MSLGPDLAPLVTVLWVLGMANAINLIDGLDGLAAGIVAIAVGHVLPLRPAARRASGLLARPNIGRCVAIIVLGICLGFLPYNFNPARIFMGDCRRPPARAADGGVDDRRRRAGRSEPALQRADLLLLRPAVHPARHPRACRSSTPPSPSSAGPPARRRVTNADKEHLHHRLMRLGHGQRRSVLILWAWTAILSGFVLYPAYTGEGDGVVPFGIAALGLGLFTVLHPGVRQRPHRAGSRPRDGTGGDDARATTRRCRLAGPDPGVVD